MKRIVPMILISMVFALASTAEPLLEGIWKHSEKPAWIAIAFHSGTGTASIARHDDNPEAKGLLLIREITAIEGVKDIWNGEMYAGDSDNFVLVELQLLAPGTLVVISEGREGRVEVLRLLRKKKKPARMPPFQQSQKQPPPPE